MASVQTSSYEGRYLKLTVVEESYSIANNTSTVRWTLESIGGSSTYYTIFNWAVTVNGQTIYDTQTTNWDTKKFPAAKGSKTGTITVNSGGNVTSTSSNAISIFGVDNKTCSTVFVVVFYFRRGNYVRIRSKRISIKYLG